MDVEEEIYLKIRRLCKEIFDYYGCQRCGNCCRFFSPSVNPDDIRRLSRYKRNMKTRDFLNKYCIYFGFKLNEYMLKTPCPFLTGNKCSVYPVRPLLCRTFPFEISKELLMVKLEGIEFCPTATLIADDLTKFYDDYKQFFAPDDGEEHEGDLLLENLLDKTGKVFSERRKQLGLPSVSNRFISFNIIVLYLFYLYKIKKVDDIEHWIETAVVSPKHIVMQMLYDDF